VLILPLPPLLLDFSLAISIIFSVLILMTALFIHTPLEFSAFPTVLLIATMLRLALNLASTRLILSRGHEGTDDTGHVIEAFGNFVMSGKGYTVVDAATVLSTHLTELLKNNMAELLSYGEVQKLQKELQRAGRFG